MAEHTRHILFITGEYPRQTGGVGAYTQILAAALADLDYRASVITTSKVSDQTFTGDVQVYPEVSSWNWRVDAKVGRVARQIGAEWIHIQYQTAAYAMNPSINFAVRKWQRAGFKVAWTYHDLLVPYLFPKAGERLRQFVTHHPATQADLTIVTNEGDRRQLDGIAKRLASIPIGSNIPVTKSTDAERAKYRAKLGYGQDQFVLAYFGLLNRSKGGLTLVNTLREVRKQMPDAQLLMIGERVGASDPTNFAYLQEVESLIARKDLSSAVQWTGRLDDDQVSRALAAADVLFMPYEDGASLRRGTLMAGLAHGCVIVTTHPQSPLPELVDGQHLLYVQPGDAHVAASAIRRITGDAKLADRLREGALASSKQFTWQEIARRHVSLYEAFS